MLTILLSFSSVIKRLNIIIGLAAVISLSSCSTADEHKPEPVSEPIIKRELRLDNGVVSTNYDPALLGSRIIISLNTYYFDDAEIFYNTLVGELNKKGYVVPDTRSTEELLRLQLKQSSPIMEQQQIVELGRLLKSRLLLRADFDLSSTIIRLTDIQTSRALYTNQAESREISNRSKREIVSALLADLPSANSPPQGIQTQSSSQIIQPNPLPQRQSISTTEQTQNQQPESSTEEELRKLGICTDAETNMVYVCNGG